MILCEECKSLRTWIFRVESSGLTVSEKSISSPENEEMQLVLTIEY